MEKSKHDTVTPEMRANLSANRDGKLTSDQWKNIVTEPLVTFLVLMIPGTFILGPRLATVLIGGMWFVGVLVLGGLGWMLLARAFRYSRAPLHFGTFYASQNVRPWWAFWKSDILYAEAEKPVRFAKRLAPHVRMQPGDRYLVYYLKDSDNNVLLSIAPADHTDAAKWQPTSTFQGRSARRNRR